jgi:hypothetical protein
MKGIKEHENIVFAVRSSICRRECYFKIKTGSVLASFLD